MPSSPNNPQRSQRLLYQLEIISSVLAQPTDSMRGCKTWAAGAPVLLVRRGVMSIPTFPLAGLAGIGWGCQDKHSWHSDPSGPSKQRYHNQTFSVVEISTERESALSILAKYLSDAGQTSRASR